MIKTLLLLVQMSSAGLYPTFDNNRGPWLNLPDPIVVQSGVVFGLTNPNEGSIPYDFRLEGNLNFDPTNQLIGIHSGPGNILYGITVTGQGVVSVFDGGVGVGEFTVVPEPATMVMVVMGCLLIKRRKK